MAALSDVALLDRLQGAEAWLGALVEALLAPRLDPPPPATAAAARRVRLGDATMVAPPGGRTGAAWRLHAGYDLGAGRFDRFTLTDHRGGESLERAEVAAGELLVADRYYAKAGGLHHVAAPGGAFIVRRGLTGCTLHHPDGGKFRLEAALDAPDARGPGAVADLPVLVPLLGGGGPATAPPLPARLILRCRPPAAAARARARARRKAKHPGQRVGARRLRAAGYLMLLTSLDAAACPAADVPALYRLRWQVELAFKRLKSVIGLADLQAKDASGLGPRGIGWPAHVWTPSSSSRCSASTSSGSARPFSPRPAPRPPPSPWGLCRLAVQVLGTVITGDLAFARLRAWLCHAARNLAEPPRRRPYQLAATQHLVS